VSDVNGREPRERYAGEEEEEEEEEERTEHTDKMIPFTES